MSALKNFRIISHWCRHSWVKNMEDFILSIARFTCILNDVIHLVVISSFSVNYTFPCRNGVMLRSTPHSISYSWVFSVLNTTPPTCHNRISCSRRSSIPLCLVIVLCLKYSQGRVRIQRWSLHQVRYPQDPCVIVLLAQECHLLEFREFRLSYKYFNSVSYNSC